MQEDKISKWFASLLRQQQEENPLPYELGAWEAFEKKRAATARKNTPYWISGIAASLVLLLLAGSIWLAKDTNFDDKKVSDQIAMEDKTSNSTTSNPEPTISNEPNSEGSKNSESEKLALTKPKTSKENQSNTSDTSKRPNLVTQATNSVFTEAKPMNPKEDALSKKQEQEIQTLPKVTEQSNVSENPANPKLLQSLVATQDNALGDKGAIKSILQEEKSGTKAELPKEPNLTESEIKEILDTPSFARLALGLSPGYGATQSSGQATSGSSLGLGLMVDMDIIGKLAMGSGLAVNYLNQASESQSYAQVAGFSSPVTERNEIAQVQVDIPLYFKYPITRNNSIMVQAGFSNLVTFNQAAETQTSYDRQVAVFDANAATPANSFTLKSESVNQLSILNVPQNRFIPLATANLGVNFRLFESKKTAYEVMPFYNYPLQEFSGYGEKLGMFGASFRVNFGTIKR